MKQAREAIITQALDILRREMRHPTAVISPESAKSIATLLLGALPYEVFAVMFLDTHNRLIATEELFRGTLTHTCVYPRELLREVLRHNAAAVILAHNHPGGRLEPSAADRQLTCKLKAVLGMIDVPVLDHIIVADGHALSMAEKGWV